MQYQTQMLAYVDEKNVMRMAVRMLTDSRQFYPGRHGISPSKCMNVSLLLGVEVCWQLLT
jgi:hypothetical protein